MQTAVTEETKDNINIQDYENSFGMVLTHDFFSLEVCSKEYGKPLKNMLKLND